MKNTSKYSFIILLFSLSISFSCRKKKDPEPGSDSSVTGTLAKLTNGSQKVWYFDEYLINKHSALEYFPCYEDAKLIFKNNETFLIDTTCDHSEKFVDRPYKLLTESKMIYVKDTYDIKVLSDKVLKLERPYLVKITSNLGDVDPGVWTTMELYFYSK